VIIFIARNLLSLDSFYNLILKRVNSKAGKSYTKKLVKDKEFLKRKIIEESAEVITATSKSDKVLELTDLFYFIIVFMAINKISPREIYRENAKRNIKYRGWLR
jgi:phosphoribosyl-ATP pyrophosphohydrolase